MLRLKGVITPMTTPFDADGEVQIDAMASQLDWLVTEGVDGVVVGGSTGEGHTLELPELEALVECCLRTAAGRIPVAASIICDSTRAAVTAARALARFRLPALQVVPPHYIFEPSNDEIVAFYRDVSDAAEVPIIIYNVLPWASLSVERSARIFAEVPGVAAIKQSCRDYDVLVKLIGVVSPKRVFIGVDTALMSCFDLGIAGAIAGISTAAPKACVLLKEAIHAGERERALTIHNALVNVYAVLGGPAMPARVKAAQILQGVPGGLPRRPMAPASDTVIAALRGTLAELAVALSQ